GQRLSELDTLALHQSPAAKMTPAAFPAGQGEPWLLGVQLVVIFFDLAVSLDERSWDSEERNELRARAPVAPDGTVRTGRAPGRQTTDGLAERLDRLRFVVLHVEDGVQLCDLQQVMHLLGQVQQFQFPTLIADGGVSAHQLADPGAIDVID